MRAQRMAVHLLPARVLQSLQHGVPDAAVCLELRAHKLQYAVHAGPGGAGRGSNQVGTNGSPFAFHHRHRRVVCALDIWLGIDRLQRIDLRGDACLPR